MSRNCKHCSGDMSHLHFNVKFCSQDCEKTYGSKKKAAESHEIFNETNPDDWAECPICNLRSAQIVPSHLKVHGLTVDQVKEQFPGWTSMSKSMSKKMSDRVKGSNNPGYQHGGKLSPFSTKFVGYAELTEEDKSKAALDMSATAHSNIKFHTCQIEYYLDKGMSQEDAEYALHKRQQTFTLEKCIERHGPIEGQIVWQDRQDRWMATLDSKTDAEKDAINMSKSTRVNYSTLWGLDMTTPGSFYVIRINETTVKIGITTKKIYQRYPDVNLDDVLYCENQKDINHAFMMEQLLKTRYKSHVIRNDYGDYGWTEVFNDIDPDRILLEVRHMAENQDKIQGLFDKTYKAK